MVRPMRTELMRSLVLDVVARVLDHGELADHALHRALRRHNELHSAERRLISTASYAVIRLHRRYDYLLEAGLRRAGRPALGARPTPEMHRLRYAAALTDAVGESPESAIRMAGAEPSLEPVLSVMKAADVEWPADPIARLAVEECIPGWVARRLRAEYGDRAPALAHALNARAPLVLRTNTLKTTTADLREALRKEGIETSPGRLSPWALLLGDHHNVFGLGAYKAGLFEVQDEGSQLIALATGAHAGERVIDACCGSGGKTLALAAMMRNKGIVLACDVDEHRMEDLRPRARLAGVFNLKPLVVPEGPPGDELLKPWLNRADAVLVDAPCSGSGAWRRHPDARDRLTAADLERYAARQRQILERAAACVKRGGRLVYATCSLFEEENEAVVDAFVSATSAFTPEPFRSLPAEALDASGRLKVLPHVHGTDAFFAAGFRRAR
jgi:16S rRNA (cytosine967-C5)-methyltransferase